MSLAFYKFLIILFLFIGESLYLCSEMFVAKGALDGSSKITTLGPAILMVVVGGFIFLASVYFGMRLFKDVWIIAVMSVAAIVIMEPVLVWLFFNQLPTTKTAIGFLLGVAGLVISVL